MVEGRSVKIPYLISLLAWLLAAACNSSTLPELPAEEIVQRTAERMSGMTGFHFTIDRSGAPAFLDSLETLSFRHAEGDYVAPDRARASVRIIAPGFVTDVSVVSVADIQWETNVLTGQWEQLPPDWGFNPTVLFDGESGLQAILTSDLSITGIVESERIEDELLYKMSGRVSGQRLQRVSGGLIGPDSVEILLWIAPNSYELHRVLVVEPEVGYDEPSLWQLDFSGFDEAVQIEPPVMEQQ